MGQIGVWQILIVAVVIVLLFGRGKISEVMGDFAKGINSFKKGLNDKDEEQDVADAIDNKSPENIVDVTANKTKSSS